MKRFILYLIRWQLSTPILAVCLILLSGLGEIWSTVIANFIGAIVMYPIDRFIFSSDRQRNRLGKSK